MAGQAIGERELTLADFDFQLPTELIAQHPLPERSASRLLHVTADALLDRRFGDIAGLLGPDDLLVFNDTRVIKARLYGSKPSGGKVEAAGRARAGADAARSRSCAPATTRGPAAVSFSARRSSNAMVSRPTRRFLRAALQR